MRKLLYWAVAGLCLYPLWALACTETDPFADQIREWYRSRQEIGWLRDAPPHYLGSGDVARCDAANALRNRLHEVRRDLMTMPDSAESWQLSKESLEIKIRLAELNVAELRALHIRASKELSGETDATARSFWSGRCSHLENGMRKQMEIRMRAQSQVMRM